MPALRRLVAVLLLSLWLPALLHCRLEAAGLMPGEGCCASETTAHAGESCADDLCATAEGKFQARSELKSPTPVLAPCAGLFCLCGITPSLCVPVPESGSVTDYSAAPSEVIRTWVFVERAAPSPRAP